LGYFSPPRQYQAYGLVEFLSKLSNVRKRMVIRLLSLAIERAGCQMLRRWYVVVQFHVWQCSFSCPTRKGPQCERKITSSAGRVCELLHAMATSHAVL
jgi:hypothetical protein